MLTVLFIPVPIVKQLEVCSFLVSRLLSYQIWTLHFFGACWYFSIPYEGWWDLKSIYLPNIISSLWRITTLAKVQFSCRMCFPQLFSILLLFSVLFSYCTHILVHSWSPKLTYKYNKRNLVELACWFTIFCKVNSLSREREHEYKIPKQAKLDNWKLIIVLTNLLFHYCQHSW